MLRMNRIVIPALVALVIFLIGALLTAPLAGAVFGLLCGTYLFTADNRLARQEDIIAQKITR